MSKIEKIDKNSTKTTTNFVYDENGNLLKDASHDYIYDKKARLVGVDNNISYAYNYENTRVSKTVNAQTTHFIYDGSKLIGEYNSDGSVKNEYIYLNGTPFAVTNATQTLYIHTDHLGTPRRLADENGAIVWSWESKAFGDDESVGSVKFDLRFAGQYFDSETKTHYNINRDYDPQTGRYIESDPIGFDGGVNSYGYVSGNPLGSVDEMGLKTYIFSNLNNSYYIGVGTHTGLMVIGNQINFLYDPDGSYAPFNTTYKQRVPLGSDRIQTPDSDIPLSYSDYLKFQLVDGPKVNVFTFYTSASDEKILYKEAQKVGGGTGIDCTVNISYILSKTTRLKSIKQVTYPTELADQLRKIK